MRWRKDIGFTMHAPAHIAKVEINDNNLDYHARVMMDSVVANSPIMELISQFGLPNDAQSAERFIITAVTSNKEVIDRFTELETTAFVALRSRPLRLPRPTQQDSTFPDAYPQSPILVYRNMHHAVFHITVCMARVASLIHLRTVLLQIRFTTGFQELPAYQAMLYRAQDDIEAIVSSVPFICGWTADGTHVFPNALDPTPRHPQSDGTCFAPNFVAWALAGLATSNIATAEQKEYLVHMIRYIADIRRVRQAEALRGVAAEGTAKTSLSQWRRQRMNQG